MRCFAQLSITTKLLLIGILSSGAALLLCSAGYIYNEAVSLRGQKVEEIQTTVALLDLNLSTAMAHEQTKETTKILNSLKSEPSVEMACVYDVAGSPFAIYTRDANAAQPEPVPQQPGEGVQFQGFGQMHYYSPLEDDGERIGTLLIIANTNDFWVKMSRFGWIAIIVTLCSLLVAAILSMAMQQMITEPIIELADAAEEISRGGDYSIRVSHRYRDEIGKLYDTFNRMLGKVGESENALQNAYEELEDRINERTIQLRQEIAERQNTERRLVKAIDASESANRAKSDFLANMSHEIRTPLNSILGFTDLMLRGADHDNPAAREEYLETIKKSGRHLLDLINDILDLSKIESGHLDLEMETCSPHHLISEIISVSRIAAIDKRLDLRYRWVGKVPSSIRTAPSKLRQLLINLVGNAIKFTETGGVLVQAQLVEQLDSAQLEIQVIDTGIGIPNDKLESVFDPFVQVDSSMTRRYGGTGLGLAISRRLAIALGGDLIIQSRLGEGTTCIVTVDAGSMEGVEMLDTPLTDALNGARNTRDDAMTEAVDLRNTTVLLVEDGLTNRKVISLMLEQAGASVVTAENGKAAIEAHHNRSYDAILMDMQMPVMDGYTAASILRQDGVDTPIIALTAHAMKGDREKCINAGCVDYLTKPVDFQLLVKTLIRNMQGTQLNDGQNERDLTAQQEALESEPNSATNKRQGTKSATETDVAAGTSTPGVDSQLTGYQEPGVCPIFSRLPTGNPAFAEIVAEFVEHLSTKIEEMVLMKNQQDVRELRRQAHWLKGTAGMAGFTEFTEWARRLSASAQDQDWEHVDQVITKIMQLADRIQTPHSPGS